MHVYAKVTHKRKLTRMFDMKWVGKLPVLDFQEIFCMVQLDFRKYICSIYLLNGNYCKIKYQNPCSDRSDVLCQNSLDLCNLLQAILTF